MNYISIGFIKENSFLTINELANKINIPITSLKRIFRFIKLKKWPGQRIRSRAKHFKCNYRKFYKNYRSEVDKIFNLYSDKNEYSHNLH